jgi:hypothetical protein
MTYLNKAVKAEIRNHVTVISLVHPTFKMGRTRPAKKHHTKATDPPAQHSKPPSTPALLEKAQELVVQCDYELALRFVRRILEQQPENVEAREMLGVSLLETGKIDAAKEASAFCDLAYCSRTNIV